MDGQEKQFLERWAAMSDDQRAALVEQMEEAMTYRPKHCPEWLDNADDPLTVRDSLDAMGYYARVEAEDTADVGALVADIAGALDKLTVRDLLTVHRLVVALASDG